MKQKGSTAYFELGIKKSFILTVFAIGFKKKNWVINFF